MIRRTALVAVALWTCTAMAGEDELAAGFANSPDAAKPRVYWWWLNSLVDREGITRDLEEYKAKGIGGVLLFDAGGAAGAMPNGPKFMGPEWRALFTHAVSEAARLGLEVSVNLCSGWDAGGPWVTPPLAARQFVQSELRLQGPQHFVGALPPPGGGADYRDVALQAFPEAPSAGRPIFQVTASSAQAPYPGVNAADGSTDSFWVSNGWHAGDAPTKERPEWVQLEFAEPYTARTMRLVPHNPYGPRRFELQTSTDGRAFATVAAFDLRQEDPGVLEFPETTARFYRVLFTASYAEQNVQVSEVAFGAMPIAGTSRVAVKSGRDSFGGWTDRGPVRGLVEAPLAPLVAPEGAGRIDPTAVVDLAEHVQADGSLAWDVPAGTWTVLRTGHVATGARVSCSSPGGEGFEVDWLGAAATAHHFRSMASVLIGDAGAHAGTTFRYVHDDSWEVGLPNWTDGFLDAFAKYRGYDARPWLPILAGRTAVGPEISDRFLYDFRKTIADCIAENHYAALARLAHARGLLVHCEAGGPCYPKAVPMDALKNLGRVDVPMGEFWQSSHWKENGQNIAGKQTASAAHIYGKRYAAAEAFTSIGPHWQEAPRDLKPTADVAFCEGINRFFMHTSTSTRPGDGQPGYEYFAGTHFNRNVTWWPQAGAWLKYVARCQFLLSQGLFVGDVCYYYGDNAPNFVEVKQVDPALGEGYDYDVCNAEVLLMRMSVAGDRIVLPDGMSYRVLVLPERNAMPLEVLRKIRDLVEAGATVVGPAPVKDPGLVDSPRRDDEVRALARELWGECDGVKTTERAFGKGRIAWGKPLRALLGERGIPPDLEYRAKDDGASLDFIHRTLPGVEAYFVANRKDRWEPSVACTFRVSGRQPELWDAVTGERRLAAAFTQRDGRTTVPLDFAPYGSIFVVFRAPIAAQASGGAARNFATYADPVAIVGPWTVAFDSRWGGPESARFERLVSWTERPEDGIRHYSGKATYRVKFDLPEALRGAGAHVALDLGVIKHLAEVRLNGTPLGVLWTEPFRVDITAAARPTGNELEIDVVNLWPNRLIGDAAVPAEQRLTRTNVQFAKDAPLIPSGLLGPVTIVAAR